MLKKREFVRKKDFKWVKRYLKLKFKEIKLEKMLQLSKKYKKA